MVKAKNIIFETEQVLVSENVVIRFNEIEQTKTGDLNTSLLKYNGALIASAINLYFNMESDFWQVPGFTED